MAAEGPPSTTFAREIKQVVDGGPSPTMTGWHCRRVDLNAGRYETALIDGLEHARASGPMYLDGEADDPFGQFASQKHPRHLRAASWSFVVSVLES